jgi:hypothetical protein
MHGDVAKAAKHNQSNNGNLIGVKAKTIQLTGQAETKNKQR